VTTQTPEVDAAEVRRRAWAENLVLSFLTPSGGFVHPSRMVETIAAALRSAEKDAARRLCDRAALVALTLRVPGYGLAPVDVRQAVAAAIRSLEV
jgi:hypothetical protein